MASFTVTGGRGEWVPGEVQTPQGNAVRKGPGRGCVDARSGEGLARDLWLGGEGRLGYRGCERQWLWRRWVEWGHWWAQPDSLDTGAGSREVSPAHVVVWALRVRACGATAPSAAADLGLCSSAPNWLPCRVRSWFVTEKKW